MGADGGIVADENEVPFIHIGQLQEGEELPDIYDTEFVYDVPVSFEKSDSIRLFVNTNMDDIFDGENGGAIEWSILRGKDGLKEGSVNLTGVEDDWEGFEAVTDSPYFEMTEDEDEKGGDFKIIELTALHGTDSGDLADTDPDGEVIDTEYNYYIRVAYYTENAEEEEAEFYAAVTVPFVPMEDVGAETLEDDTLTDEVNKETPDTKENNAEENDTQEADAVEESDTDKKDSSAEYEGVPNLDDASEKTDTDSESDKTEDGNAGLPEEGDEHNETQTSGEITVSKIILNKKNLTMTVGSTSDITAAIVPEGLTRTIDWKSSDENVAYVHGWSSNEAYIYAEGIGTAEITAECEGRKAVVTVEVVQSDAAENSDDYYNEANVIDRSGDIWIAGFQKESDDFVYSGQKITQDIRIYHKDTLLKEKTDYTISYKNNVNAARSDALKAPSVTITMKGQYSGSKTLYYTIKPLDINNIDVNKVAENSEKTDGAENGEGETGEGENVEGETVDNKVSAPGYEQVVVSGKKIPAPVLTFGKKKLAAKKDFVCDYSTIPENYKEGEIYYYKVEGIGNFTGSFNMQLAVIGSKDNKALNFSSAAVTLNEKQYVYKGAALTKDDVKIKEVKLNKKPLDSGCYDYEVCAQGIDGAYVNVYPTKTGRDKGYRGCKKINLKLVGDRNINEAVSGSGWENSLVFSKKKVDKEGGIFQKKDDILKFGEDSLIEGKDYTVKYGNAQKAGTVTVTFTGKGRYRGALKKTYSIKPNTDLTLSFQKDGSNENEAVYQKGGAVPELVLKDQDNIVLKNKTDYTVKVTNNKTVGSELTVTVNGKGNYKGYTKTAKLKVTAADISRATISVPDKAYSAKANAWKSKVTVQDVNGKKLTAGTDYDNAITYKYYDETGRLTDAGSSSPKAGSIIYVTIKGKGNYTGSVTGSYRIFKNNISRLKIKVDDKEYTGNEIELSKSNDIHVYENSSAMRKKTELADKGSCFEIAGYKNNLKAGAAKVTLRGIGDYGGTKTYSFKIKKKAYNTNHVKKITLVNTSLTISIEEESKELVYELETDNNAKADNETVIWTTSNSNIAEVDNGIVIPKSKGSVTITATTQDGNKKAKCNVKVVYSPLLKDAGQTIKIKAGETYALKFADPKHPEVSVGETVWESSNPDMASIDGNGVITMKKGAAIIKVYTCNREYVQQCFAVADEEEVLPEGNWVKIAKQEGAENDNKAFSDITYNWMDYYAGTYDGIYVPAGVYMIDTQQAIPVWNLSNMEIRMSPGAILMAIASKSGGEYNVISVTNSDHVTISGGQIIGERYEHKGTKGESGHGIGVYSSANVHIEGVDVSSCWGDGIYVGLAYQSKTSCDNVEIINCNVHNNRRNNLSITAGDNVTIDNCQFNNAKGTDPQYGIDIETNTKDPCEHITIRNTKMLKNAKGSMGIMTSANDILLENCELDGILWNDAGKNVVLKNTKVKSIQGKRKDDVKRQ